MIRLDGTTTTRDSATTRAPASESSAYRDHPPEKLARKIESLSADGTPAHPEIGPGRITLMLVALGIVIVLVGVGIGLWLGTLAGIAIGGLGFVLFVVSPAFWASVSRARDRRKAKVRLEQQEEVALHPERRPTKTKR